MGEKWKFLGHKKRNPAAGFLFAARRGFSLLISEGIVTFRSGR